MKNTKSILVSALAGLGAILASMLPWVFGDLPLPWRLVITLAIIAIALVVIIIVMMLSRTHQPAKIGDPNPTLEVPASPRLAAELKDGDPLLNAADHAVFVGLTFRSLSVALSNGRIAATKLREATFYAFSLPVLTLLHPTLRGRPGLNDEWRVHLTNALTGMLDAAPHLQKLDLLLLDADPSFTMSKLRSHPTGGSPHWVLRWTPLIEGTEPREMPTLIFERSPQHPGELDSAFEAFDTLSKDLVNRRAVRRFPILRRDKPYLRDDLRGFVDSLASVSTHPLVRIPDAAFRATLIGPKQLLPKERVIQPWEVRQIYEKCLTQDALTFQARTSPKTGEVTIEITDGSRRSPETREVAGTHFVAAFALLVLGPPHARRILLVDKAKPGWKLDVPGGKLAAGDATWSDGLRRELLEELSLHMNAEEFPESGWVYDAKSRKEGEPVIAGYSIHYLSDTDTRYVEQFLIGQTEASGSKILATPLSKLIRAKREARRESKFEEVECHAPLHVLELI